MKNCTRSQDQNISIYKVFSTDQPSYIYDLLPPLRSYPRHVNSFNLVSCKSNYLKTSFIPNVIYKQNKLDPDICSSFLYNLISTLILYGSDKFDDKKNHIILMCTIKFIKDSQRFDENMLYFFGINVKRIHVSFKCIFQVYYIFLSFNIFQFFPY